MEQTNKVKIQVGEYPVVECDVAIGVGITESGDSVDIDIILEGGGSLTAMGVAVGRLLAKIEEDVGKEDMDHILRVARITTARQAEKETNSGKNNN